MWLTLCGFGGWLACLKFLDNPKTGQVYQVSNWANAPLGLFIIYVFHAQKSVKEVGPSVLGMNWEEVLATVEARKMPNPQSQCVERNSERLVDKEWMGGARQGQLGTSCQWEVFK